MQRYESLQKSKQKNRKEGHPTKRQTGTPADLEPGQNPKTNIETAIKRDIIKLYSLRYMAWKIAEDHRVCMCGKYPIQGKNPEIWANEKNDKSYIKHTIHCDSVWACPICRFKIMSIRTNEIINICKGEKKIGKYMSFLTLTRWHRRHKTEEELKEMVKKFNQDFRYITCRKSIMIFKETGFEYIKALDTMYNSKNGHHFHFHIILFANSREELEMIAGTITYEWLKVSNKDEKRTTKVNQKHIQVYDNEREELEKYISKMNMALELTNLYSSKNSKHKSINPLNALRALIEKDYSVFTEKELIKMYNEYIQITKCIRSITMSKGLKARHKIEDKTDEQICQDTTELKTEIATISKELYKRLARINSVHELMIAGDNYLKNQSTIMLELRKILTDRLTIELEWRNNIITACDESTEPEEINYIKNLKVKQYSWIYRNLKRSKP